MDPSPSKLRLRQLSERLLNLQSGVEQDRYTRIESFQQKLKNLENRVDASSLNFDTKYKMLKDHVGKVTETLSSDKISRDILDQKKSKQLKLVENNLMIDLNLLGQHRKQHQAQVGKILDEKVFNLRLQLAKEKKVREEITQQQTQQLEQSINRLRATIDNQTNLREQAVDRLTQIVQDEFQKFDLEISSEKKKREESMHAMVKMLEETQERLQGAIENERVERESTEQTLLKLLEETCIRVEGTLRQSVIQRK